MVFVMVFLKLCIETFLKSSPILFLKKTNKQQPVFPVSNPAIAIIFWSQTAAIVRLFDM